MVLRSVTMRVFQCRWILAIVLVFSRGITAIAGQTLPMITVKGTQFVDTVGSPVTLRGCNLGNYLMLESWMFGQTLGTGPEHRFADGLTLCRTLQRRFGEEKSRHLIDLYRTRWITPRDFQNIKAFGFNTVRLPFDCRLIQDDQEPYAIKPDAFRWLDHAVQMAADAGVYVILDLHGVPGGQSLEDHTGEAGQDHLWTSKADQQRTVEIWRALAEHFKYQSAVAAYDLINEPYGNHSEDCRPVLARLVPQILQAIRSTGDQHVVFFPGALNGGIAFYGNPHESGMTNVAFTEHYYPGLFGGIPALESQARVLNQQLPAKRDYLRQIASPYFVGEFNVVLDAEDPARVMRAYYDLFNQYGWACTMWSYKLLSTRGGVGQNVWYMVTNADPLPMVDVENSSYQDIESFFSALATMPLATNARLREALTTASPEPLYLANYPRLPTSPPTGPDSDPQGYTSADLGDATAGYTNVLPDGSTTVMGGGSDVFGTKDACRFVSRAVSNDSADECATILTFTDSAEFAKAGIMARWGDANDPHAAMAMVNLFPDGTVALIARERAGAGAIERKTPTDMLLPVELRLKLSAGKATGLYRDNTGEWLSIGSMAVPSAAPLRIGLAVCSHTESVLTTVTARLGAAGDVGLPVPGHQAANAPFGPSLLVNGSFEQQGSSIDMAADWNRWGPWMNRETAWTPTHSGSCEIGYHHWQVDSNETSGLWQDVDAVAGKRYTFSIFAQRDAAAPGQTEARTIELRLESVTDHGQLALNTKNFDVERLASGAAWSRLSISGTAESTRLRVLFVINPAVNGPRGGAIKLDDAMLVDANDGK